MEYLQMRRSFAGLSRCVVLGGVVLAGCAPRAASGDGYVVFFTPWSAQLDDPAMSVVASAAAAAQAAPGRPVLVEGYADSIGSAQANMSMSATRAQVVADGLAADGVARSRIVLRPRGQTAGDPGIESRRVVIEIGQ